MKIKDYFTPKSLVYSGKYQNKETQIRHIHYKDDDVFETDKMDIKDGYKSYIQVIGLNDVEKIKTLKSLFNIDDLIFEDVFNVTQRIKIDVREHYIFSVIHGIFTVNKKNIKEYMSILCINDVVISFHEQEPWFLDTTIKAFETYPEIRRKSSDFLFYHILDLITDNHIDVFDELNETISQFEDITLNEQILPQEEFYRVRKAFVRLKNNAYYTLQALEGLMKKSHPLIQKENIEYFHDLLDHLNRLDGQINIARENLRNLVDVNINNQSNRMNKIMTTLTLFSATFIPLSFFTGFFGMNFIHFEILEYQDAIWWFIGFCVMVIVFMVWFFRRKKWL